MASLFNQVCVLHIHKLIMIKHHSAFENKSILIVKPRSPQKYILMGKALIHKDKNACQHCVAPVLSYSNIM